MGAEQKRRLLQALSAESGFVCLVGAGGKKTTMYALAAAHPGRVLLSSTSHMYPYDSARVDTTLTVNGSDTVRPPLGDGRVVAAAGATETPKRVGGLDAEQIRALYVEGHFDLCLIKADGARARWIKSPGPHEPLIPDFADTVIPVVSARVLGAPLDERVAHRPERLTQLLGIEPGAPIEPQHLSALLSHPQGSLKGVGKATVVPLINMVDDDACRRVAHQIAVAALARTDRIERVVLACMKEARLVEVVGRG